MTIDRIKWTIAGLFLSALFGSMVFAAVQGDTVINAVDPTNAVKFTRVVGTPATGIRTTIMNTITNPVPVTQLTATSLNATVVQPTASLLNATVVQPTAANLNVTSKITNTSGTLINPATSDIGTPSTGNSSTAALGSYATFTGVWVDTLNYAQIIVTIKSNQTGSLKLQRSSTGATVGNEAVYDYTTAGQGLKNYFAVGGRYARIVYTNGATAQSTFVLATTLVSIPIGFTFQPLSEEQNDDSVSLNTIANISGKRINDGVHSIVPLMADNSLAVTATPYLYAIAEGAVPNHSLVRKLGYSPASTAAQTTLWNAGTEYVFPTGAITVEAISSSPSDSAGSSTGAKTIHLEYLTTGYVVSEYTFTMNGNTAVAGPADFFRVNSFHVKTGKAAAGVIDLRLTGGAATIYTQMPIGATRARNSVYTVPIGRTLYIDSLLFSAAYKTAGKTVRMTLHASITPDGVVNNTGALFFPFFEAMLVDNNVVSAANAPIIMPATTDIKVSVIGETLVQCTSEITGWLE